MKLTEDQREVVNYDGGNTLVTACPGSGKTHTIIAKLIRCLDRVQGTPRKIACITYTNAAVYEIENRVRRSATGDVARCDVATIHSFCLNHILRNFYWKLDGFENGLEILPNDSAEHLQIVAEIANRHRLNDFDRDNHFELLGREPSGAPILAGGITEEAAFEYWDELERRGYVDFSGILYYSYVLVKSHSFIAHSLGAKFHTILIDEFQDTTALQTALFLEIHAVGLTEFVLVGDPEQCIYSFAGADPKLLREFSKRVSAKPFTLSGNFRSSQKVIDCAEKVISRNPPMYMAHQGNDYGEEPLIVGAANSFDAITDYFLPALDAVGIDYGDAAILAPSWYELYPLGKKLREYGVPIIGPGARPYKRSHLIGRIAEPVAEAISRPSASGIRRIEKELSLLVRDMTGSYRLGSDSFGSRRIAYLLQMEGERLSEEHESAGDWLNACATNFAKILTDAELISSHDAELFSESVESILSEIEKNNVDLENMSISDLGLVASAEGSIKLLTMHKSKGREFDAVAMIALNDGQIPFHNYYNPITDQKLEESRRQFYVSVTRTRRMLMMFYKENNAKPPSRFLDGLA